MAQTATAKRKLLQYGAQSLSDAELLAIFLRTGIKGCNAVELAQRVITQCGSLQALLQSDLNAFCHIKGLGKAKYVQLQACLEFSRRYLQESMVEQATLTSPSQSYDFLKAALKHETREVFALLLLNNQHKVLRFDKLFYGTIDAAAVYPRIVVQHALSHNAAAVIFATIIPRALQKQAMPTKR